MSHEEHHRVHRVGWLRAAVLGANDGIVSTSSLIIGVAAAQTTHENVLLAGAAGLVAGAMSMAAGEYVSVSSQADTERADLEIERRALEQNYDLEKEELAGIYVKRGLEPALADELLLQLRETVSLHTKRPRCPHRPMGIRPLSPRGRPARPPQSRSLRPEIRSAAIA